MSGISFSAILNKITTTIDGGWRVSFDVPQSESEGIMALSQMRDATLQLGIVDLYASANSEKTE